MSAINGDKARFHRKRKSRIAGRARKRQLLAERRLSADSSSEKKGAAE